MCVDYLVLVVSAVCVSEICMHLVCEGLVCMMRVYQMCVVHLKSLCVFKHDVIVLFLRMRCMYAV